MSNFSKAQKFTAKWEKGTVNHKDDPGGITKNGMSIRFLKDYSLKEKNKQFLEEIGVLLPIVPDSIFSLTDNQIDQIFDRAFWDVLKLDELNELTAIVVYDAAVNSGNNQSIKFLQRACNDLSNNNLDTDGIIGPKTRECANQLDDKKLALKCIEYREKFYYDLVEGKPSFKSFIKGWINRTTDLKQYIS